MLAGTKSVLLTLFACSFQRRAALKITERLHSSIRSPRNTHCRVMEDLEARGIGKSPLE